MGFIAWIVFGALAGWVASMIMKTDGSMGALANIVVGIIGAVLGGWISSSFGGPAVSGFDVRSFVVAVLGAVVLLALLKMVGRGRTSIQE